METLAYDLDVSSLDRSLRIQELQNYIERLMSHQVLKQEFVLPTLSRLQLWLGALVLSRAGISQPMRERILAATILMYHGLSLHENVTEGLDPQKRRRQLIVLGGDYMSSLFYRLLAEAGRVDMIGLFAKAIARINEAKVSLYAPELDDDYGEAEYLHDARLVQGELLHTLCDRFVPEEKTRAFVQAAITASIYDTELDRRGDHTAKSLANVLLTQCATPDERKLWLDATSDRAVSDKRVAASLHAKYGTFTRILQGFRDAAEHVRVLSTDVLGTDAWPQFERLFAGILLIRNDEAPVVEGG